MLCLYPNCIIVAVVCLYIDKQTDKCYNDPSLAFLSILINQFFYVLGLDYHIDISPIFDTISPLSHLPIDTVCTCSTKRIPPINFIGHSFIQLRLRQGVFFVCYNNSGATRQSSYHSLKCH